MPDGKYGRIFTEEDVREILVFACDDNKLSAGEAMNDLVHSKHSPVQTRFPADEPIFVLRGQDRLALGAIQHYYHRCMGRLRPQALLTEVERALKAFEQFRADHPDRIKYPD